MNSNNKLESKLDHSNEYSYEKVNIHIDEKLIYDNDRLGGIDINSEIQEFIKDTNAKEFVFKIIK